MPKSAERCAEERAAMREKNTATIGVVFCEEWVFGYEDQ